MKNSIYLFAAIGILILTGCGNQRVSYILNIDGEMVDYCKDAEVVELNPENGGYRFNCGKEKSLYVTYGTYDDPLKGSIKSLMLNDSARGLYGHTEMMYAAYYANANDKSIKCEKAKKLNRVTGEKVFELNFFKRIKYNTYKLMMSKPCGELSFTIDSPD